MFTLTLQSLSGASFWVLGLKVLEFFVLFLLAVELMWDITQFLLFHISQSHWIFLFRGRSWNLSIAHFVADTVTVCSASCSKRIVFRRPFEKIYHRQVSSSLFRSTKRIVTKNKCKIYRYLSLFLTLSISPIDSMFYKDLRPPRPAETKLKRRMSGVNEL